MMNRVVPPVLFAMSLGLASCALDAELPESVPITSLEVQRISHDTKVAEARASLASDGYTLELEQGAVYHRGDDYAAVFPVASETGAACEYRSLTYQEIEGQVNVFLERGEPGESSPKASIPQTQGYTCGPWSGWYELSTWCGDSFPSCFWEGFKGHQRREWRIRQCCDAVVPCWAETEYQTVVTHCGC